MLSLQKYGHIDIVVSNAAANPTVDGILDMKESVLDKLWEINVKATILLLQVPRILIQYFTFNSAAFSSNFYLDLSCRMLCHICVRDHRSSLYHPSQDIIHKQHWPCMVLQRQLFLDWLRYLSSHMGIASS